MFGNRNTHEDSNYPFPSLVLTDAKKASVARYKLTIRKRKMGVVSLLVDTIKFYPNQENVVQIDW